jgi:hypothetical protein
LTKNLSKITVLAVFTIATLACSLFNGDGLSLVPPGVLFQDEFSNPSSGWDQVDDGEAFTDYANDAYRIIVNVENTDVWANPGLNFTDTVIEVEATKLGGPDDNDFGLICRYQSPSNFYFFLISSDGFYSIGKWSGGEQISISSESMEYSEAINQGSASNTIRADCVGSRLTLWVNDQLLVEATDTDFTTGDVGLIAGTFAIPGTDIQFDNFVVREP